jgi:hypothetical protein
LLSGRRVQAHGIHLRRLVYLSKEEFKFLRLLRKSFLKRTRQFFIKPPRTRFVTKKEASGYPTNGDLRSRIDNHTPCYEPTNIDATRNSLFWRWRRVKEYYRDFLGMEDNGQAKEVYALIHS